MKASLDDPKPACEVVLGVRDHSTAAGFRSADTLCRHRIAYRNEAMKNEA